MLRFFCLIVFLLAASVAYPDEVEEPLPPLTRSGAIQLALQRNLDLQAARFAIRRAVAAAVDAGALPNPEISLSGASDFAFNNEGEYAWSMGLSQQFPITGRLRTLRSLAEQEIELAKAEIRLAELELAASVARVCDALQAVSLEMQLLEEQQTLNATFEEFLQTKVRRAEASSLDVRQARLASSALDQRLARSERQRAELLSELRLLLAMQTDELLTIAEPVESWPEALPVFTREDLTGHPALALKQQFAVIAGIQSDLATAERWGDITVQVFFEEEYGVDEPVGFERERFFGIGVSIPLPLHNRNRGAIESSRLRERQIEAELRATEYRLLSRAEALRGLYLNLQQQIQSYRRELIAPAEASLAEIEDAFQTGLVDLTDVFRAQERLLDLRLELLELKAERSELLTQWKTSTAQIFNTSILP